MSDDHLNYYSNLWLSWHPSTQAMIPFDEYLEIVEENSALSIVHFLDEIRENEKEIYKLARRQISSRLFAEILT